MVDDVALYELLGRRRDRAIAIILSCKERECDEYLPVAASSKLRKVVLDQLNELTEIAVDLVRSVAGTEVVFNEHFLVAMRGALREAADAARY